MGQCTSLVTATYINVPLNTTPSTGHPTPTLTTPLNMVEELQETDKISHQHLLFVS